MAHKAPGKSDREGMSLLDLFRKFPDDKAARAWFEEARWGGTPFCPHCGSENVLSDISDASMTHRCREKGCGKKFSVRVKTAMESSRIPLHKWAIAIYLMTTSLKSVSSMKLHRDLDITQKSAWFLSQRIRQWVESSDQNGFNFSGPVEADETYVGGNRKNMSHAKRSKMTGRGAVGKTAVVGVKDRDTNRVSAKVVESTDKPTLQGFISDNTGADATVYTDENRAYQGLPFQHETVRHSVGEYVRGQVHTNGIESFWSMLKRAHKGTFHKLSPKHLDRYVKEFAGKHNLRELDTIDQMRFVWRGMERKRLQYKDLIEDNGHSSQARLR